jgi:uncharacterized membrane protein
MSTGYNIMKTLHIFFVVIFLGNIIVSILWKRMGDRNGDPKIMAHTMRGIIKADRVFTMPAVIGLIIFGFGAQGMGAFSITAGWILWSIVLVVISAGAFMGVVVPSQKKMAALAESGNFNRNEYDELSKKWNLWGTIAIIAPIIATILMVFKLPA